ncbi:MAG: Tll0287-like domain-containing protein [Planctomycetota bacterium]|jgi:hypothetical protein
MKGVFAVTATGVAVAFALAFSVERSHQGADGHGIGDVVREVEGLNSLRSGLAASFTGEPDQSAFAKVCKPAGAQVQRLAMEYGWQIAQLAEKHRNPKNELDHEARRVFKMMEDDEDLMGMWIKTEMDGKPGMRYFRRIVVEQACLACHGSKSGRPQFVKDGYPGDRAYGFDVGDLRGVYSVFVAE